MVRHCCDTSNCSRNWYRFNRSDQSIRPTCLFFRGLEGIRILRNSPGLCELPTAASAAVGDRGQRQFASQTSTPIPHTVSAKGGILAVGQFVRLALQDSALWHDLCETWLCRGPSDEPYLRRQRAHTPCTIRPSPRLLRCVNRHATLVWSCSPRGPTAMPLRR